MSGQVMASMKYNVLLLALALTAGACNCWEGDRTDWLVDDREFKGNIQLADDGKELSMSNGLVERRFRITPNFATIAFKNLVTDESYLRSVRPEARISIDGTVYNIGGLTGQPIHNYLLPEWIETLSNDETSFQYVKYTIGDIKPRFEWKVRKEWISGSSNTDWPPKGKEVVVDFRGPENSPASGLVARVHYEIYDGLPLISKWISVHNESGKTVMLDSFVSEILAAVEGESSVEGEYTWELPNMHVETDFAFAAMSNRKANHGAVYWMTDSTYTSQVNYALNTPCLLEVRPPLGPAQEIPAGGSFESFRVWELLFDSFDKERNGLATRKMYRTIAPWVTENPVLMHVRQADSAAVKLAIDQAAEVGFELVIMTFGSGFNMESGDPQYYKEVKRLADYAHSKGIALGGYSLLASRTISEKDDVINPETGKPGGVAYFSQSPCIGSEWGIEYFRKIREMYEATSLDVIEHDGSYPGDICGATWHPGHKGLNDSQWNQFQTISDFYQWCRSQGIYLNVPDWYYLNGSSKCGMGYRETNWSLPRAQQEIIERQNIFDGTWTKTPSMGWMFVPLTQYHGGGAAATIEPLNEHLPHYEQRLANLFGAGVQACYRGPRLYDTDSTKTVVKKWVDIYKKHRQILDSDIIHLRRPDGSDWDGILHVNPYADEKGFLMVYNPLEEQVTRELKIPVYYTGLWDKVTVEADNGETTKVRVSRDYVISLTVTIQAHGYRYYVLK